MDIIVKIFLFAILIALFIKAYRLMLTFRKKLSCTTGMLAAMIIGSMNGLIAGTVLGVDLDFSINCILAMIIGMSSGVMIGIPFNTLAVLDGLISGVMNGMMGAMLAAMLPASFLYPISFLFIVILFVSVLLLHQSMKQEAGILRQNAPTGEMIKRRSILIASVTVALISLVMAVSLRIDHPGSSDHIHLHDEYHR